MDGRGAAPHGPILSELGLQAKNLNQPRRESLTHPHQQHNKPVSADEVYALGELFRSVSNSLVAVS